MQLASLIVGSASLAVSATILVVILVGAKRARAMVTEATQTAESKIGALKKAVADL
jgi:hypothetical protein